MDDYISDCAIRMSGRYVANNRDIPNSGGALAVSIYAPNLIWNMTGMDLEIRSKSFLRQADAVPYKIKPSTTFYNSSKYRTKLYVLL